MGDVERRSAASAVESAADTVPVIETERLSLRRLDAGDAPFILELVNEPGWLRFIGDRKVHDLDAARLYIENGPQAMYRRYGYGLYRVQLHDGTPIGLCGLVKRDGLEDVDLGFALLGRFEGRGYAREAAAASLTHAAREHGLGRVAAITDPANARSIHLLQAVGFKPAGQRRLTPQAELLSFFLWQPAIAPGSGA
jgi:[ribosomal protein S5]-alanine N-acetyltransferase